MLEELAAKWAEMESRILSLEAENEALKKENDNLRTKLGMEVKVEEEPLKTFPSVQDIVWERWPDNDDTKKCFNDLYMTSVLLGTKFVPPWKHAIVEGLGEVRRGGGPGTQMPDWYAIAHHRVLDVTAKPWVRIVPSDDDGYESDPKDMAALVKNYSGALRYPLSSWDMHKTGMEMKKLYLQTHQDPGTNYTVRNPSSLSSFGNP